jgi:hypothetical protein
VYLQINDWQSILSGGSHGSQQANFRSGQGGGSGAARGGGSSVAKLPLFAKVMLDGVAGGWLINKHVSTPITLIDRQIDELSVLNITWVDEWGNLMDFGDVDHSFSLELVEMVGRLEGTGYSEASGGFDFQSGVEALRLSRN